jgi:hypothetical protein
MKKLLILLFIFSFGVQGAGKNNKIPLAKKLVLKTEFLGIFDSIWNGRKDGTHKVLSEDMKALANEFLTNLHYDGYIRADQFDIHLASYRELANAKADGDIINNMRADLPLTENLVKQLFKGIYGLWIDSVLTGIANNPKECSNNGDPSNAGICCNSDYISNLFVGFDKSQHASSNSCKDKGVACSSHSDCCSESCKKSDYFGADKGICEAVKTCYELIEYGKECSVPEKPYCVPKHEINGTDYSISCRNIDAKSTNINECKAVGNQCDSGADCCSLKCDNKKCVEQKKCDVCLIINQSVKDNPGVKCCEGLYENLKGKCIPKFPVYIPASVNLNPSIDKATILDKFFSLFSMSSYASELCERFSKDDNKKIQDYIKTCWHKEKPEQEKECLDALGDYKKSLLTVSFNNNKTKVEEETAKCNKKPTAEKEKCIKDNVSGLMAGCQTKMSEKEYANAFNISSIQTMTFSDPDKCVFNSFHDSWRDASALERNAEIVMRGFEYVYTGDGAQDMWVQKDKTKNIFDRARDIAVEIRKSRAALIESSRETDREMMCECVAIKKRVGVDSMVLEDFENDPRCENQRAELAAMNDSNPEGNNPLDSEKKSLAYSSKGAIGLSHEKMMMKFLSLRQKTQNDRFDRNAKLEKELQELSEYIENNDWMVSSETKKVTLYNFGVKWYQGWLAWVVAIIAIVAAPFTGGASLVLFVAVGMFISSKPGHEDESPQVVNVVTESDNNARAYNGKDYDFKQGKCHRKFLGICYMDRFKIDRVFIHPKFDNGQSNSKYKCDVDHFSYACIRNIYKSKFEGKDVNIIDLKKPLFVDEGVWKKDTLWVKNWNDHIKNFIKKLEATKPNGYQQRRYLGEPNLMARQEIQEAMVLSNDKLPKDFTESMKQAFKAGVVKYAGCRKLIGNEPGDPCRVNLSGTNIVLEENAIGYGYLFEKEADMANFAEYVYQHHFHWPSISASEKMGYPLLSQSAYFMSIATNLALIGSSAASRMNASGEAFDHYYASWNKRKNEYACAGDSSGACAAEEVGSGSMNVQYSDDFKVAFKTLDFQNGTFTSQFVDAAGNIKAGNMSTAEQETLKNGVQKAMRAAEKVKKAAHYKKVVGDTPRGKIIAKGYEKWNEKFGKPLNKIKMSVGAQEFGGNSKYNGTSGNTPAVSSTSKKSNISNSVSSYKAPKFDMPSYETPSYQTGGDSSGASIKTGLQDEQNLKNTYILDNALKNKSMYERDDSDSIFKVVSKAYYRNLGLILERAGIKTDQTKIPGLEFKDTKKDLSKDKKSELKKLLSN